MELVVGSIYEGKVTGIAKFGVFVSFEGGNSGLVHISEVSNSFVSDVSQHVKMGQSIMVKVVSITDAGKINLSIKQVPQQSAPPAEAPRAPRIEMPVKHAKYVMAPATSQVVNENSSVLDFEDRLKKFMQESDSRIADSRLYEKKPRSRRK